MKLNIKLCTKVFPESYTASYVFRKAPALLGSPSWKWRLMLLSLHCKTGKKPLCVSSNWLANSQDSRVTIFYKHTDKTGKRNVPLRIFRYSYSFLFLSGLRRQGHLQTDLDVRVSHTQQPAGWSIQHQDIVLSPCTDKCFLFCYISNSNLFHRDLYLLFYLLWHSSFLFAFLFSISKPI